MTFETETREEVFQSMVERALGGIYRPGDPGNIQYGFSCRTYHRPTSTSISLSRDILPFTGQKVWHLSISFTIQKGFLPFNQESATEWLRIVFGKWVGQVVPMPGLSHPSIRHYLLVCPSDFIDLAHDR